jgi:hypothetical protein
LDKVLDYDRMQAELLILDSITVYEALHEEDKTLPMLLFLLYFSPQHPRYFDDGAIWRPPFPKGCEPENLVKLNRTEFFAKMGALLSED